ncbi:CBS domain-containing protein [Nonomuraea sp. PA05]|uniref:CBS domain-containing protein n=1 Tax=Nonomuraea sp. PA05 TaxID=2604466 RepID=UPI0011DA35AF|nr:CBS domain-containing protein [Nonomuraea sp. PA05]TYB60232.1 CBS domain-containing protein [Nonomuraea sp. PA05]
MMKITVRDVMTTDVATVRRQTPFHAVAELLISRGVSGVPVVDDDDRVLGIVSEADLLAKEEFKERFHGDGYRPALRTRLRHSASSGDHEPTGESAGELMTSPAQVITPDASVVTAARQMDRHGVKRLPVIGTDGRLVGIVSRRDLITVFLRTDHDLLTQVKDAIRADELGLTVTVTDGVVTISGAFPEHSQPGTATLLAEGVDGVVAVHLLLTRQDSQDGA